jgi:tetrahydromethanopterin S-methyltransferase subunit G
MNTEIRHEPITKDDNEILTRGVFKKELKAAFLEFGEIMMRGFEALEERMNKKFAEVHQRIDKITLITVRREEHLKLRSRVDHVEDVLDITPCNDSKKLS